MIKTFHLSVHVGPSLRSACTHRCIMDPVCVSVNIGPPTEEKFICELSDSDHVKHPEDLKKREGFLYISTEVIKWLWVYVEDIFFVIHNLTQILDINVTALPRKENETEEVYFVLIRIPASATHAFMIQFAWTVIQTNSISVNAELVIPGNNAKKVRITDSVSCVRQGCPLLSYLSALSVEVLAKISQGNSGKQKCCRHLSEQKRN